MDNSILESLVYGVTNVFVCYGAFNLGVAVRIKERVEGGISLEDIDEERRESTGIWRAFSLLTTPAYHFVKKYYWSD